MIYVILIMILFHIIDDFVFQPICLSELKQKTFWEPYIKDNSLYKNDYKVALAIHGLSWAIMIHIPLMVYGVNEICLCISVILNSIIHSYIDDKKANKLNISLLEDQLLHGIQIAGTFAILTCI